MNRQAKSIIGRTTRISFIDAGIKDLPAKVDTGAYSSSIWASDITEKDGVLYFTLLGPKSSKYSGKKMESRDYKITNVENSFGHNEDRYAVVLKVKIGNSTFDALFTLAKRDIKSYSALIGRKLLKDRYLVDVSKSEVERSLAKRGGK